MKLKRKKVLPLNMCGAAGCRRTTQLHLVEIEGREEEFALCDEHVGEDFEGHEAVLIVGDDETNEPELSEADRKTIRYMAALGESAEAIAEEVGCSATVAQAAVDLMAKPEEEEEEGEIALSEIALRQEASTAQEVLTHIQAMDLQTNEDVEFAAELLADAKGQWKRLEEMKKSATKPMNDALKSIRSWFKPAQDFYKNSESAIKTKIATFNR